MEATHEELEKNWEELSTAEKEVLGVTTPEQFYALKNIHNILTSNQTVFEPGKQDQQLLIREFNRIKEVEESGGRTRTVVVWKMAAVVFGLLLLALVFRTELRNQNAKKLFVYRGDQLIEQVPIPGLSLLPDSAEVLVLQPVAVGETPESSQGNHSQELARIAEQAGLVNSALINHPDQPGGLRLSSDSDWRKYQVVSY